MNLLSLICRVLSVSCSYICAVCRITRTHILIRIQRNWKVFRLLSSCALVLETADPLKVVHRVILNSCPSFALRGIVVYEGDLLTQYEISSALVFMWYSWIFLHSADCVVSRVQSCLLIRVRLPSLLCSNCFQQYYPHFI